MKLHSPAFQKSLKRGVKKAVRESRALRKEYRQSRRNIFTRVIPGSFVRMAMSAALGGMVAGVMNTTRHTATALAVIALWTLFVVFFRALALWQMIHTSRELAALLLLPMPGDVMFRWQLQKFFRGSLASLADLAVAFVVLAACLQFSPGQWLALPCVVAVTWLLQVALAILCSTRVPPRIMQQIVGGAILLGFGLMIGIGFVGAVLAGFLDRTAPVLNPILPTGWAVLLFNLLLPGRNWALLFLLVPVGLVICTLKNSLDQLRASFRFIEENLHFEPRFVHVSAGDARANAVPPEHPQADEGPTAIAEFVESRQFLAPPAWPRSGLLEKLLWRWLTPREKALAEFVFPNGRAITAPWLKTVRNFALGMTAAFAVRTVIPSCEIWAIVGVVFVVGFPALGHLLDTGCAFRGISNGGIHIPIYAAFGIGYRELSRLLVKCSVIQLPVFVPFVTLFCALAMWMSRFPWHAGIIPGLKAAVLLFATRYITLLLSFSSGTNDSSRFRLHTLPLIALVMGLGVLFLALGAAGIFAPYGMNSWGLIALAVLDAWLLFQIYGWFYNRKFFDLMNAPR